MIALSGYQIKEKIDSGLSTSIYRGIRERDNQSVIVKVLTSEYPTLSEITILKHEYFIAKDIDVQGIVKVYDMEKYNQGFALILEDVVGKSLRELFMSEKLKLRELLRIAIAVVDGLGDMHQIPVIHKDIKPSNIIVNNETGQVKITDFGIASRLSVENPTISNPNLLEGTLAYISPEQTGRMNRTIDYRADYYSLGATFYEMLTGQLPFTTTDPMEMVYCHIAKQPVPPHEVHPEIPEAVSGIVMKLLAKTAEDRYQSAAGLKYDLETCLEQLQTHGKIEKFPLGQRDRGSQLRIPQKLYGREQEVRSLMDAFSRVSQGKTEMMLVSGYSGIGKTAIVNEVHKPIVKARGYFIAGKFDQFKRNIPYSALIQAFSGLIRQLLTETAERIENWKQKLADALGSNGRVISDVIPEVELIIGPQPEVPELGPTESQNRFNRVFQEFVGVFAQQSHPLVLFLDDLQWADSASLKLIQLLMTDLESQYLLMLGAYRDNEVSPTHPSIQTISKIQEAGAVVNNITIGPLSLEHVSQLVAETLGDTEEPSQSVGNTVSGGLSKGLSGGRAKQRNSLALSSLRGGGALGKKRSVVKVTGGGRTKPLAELVFHKTQGNPFFLTQLLKTLHSESLLSYEVAKDSWEWDIAKIQAVGIADYNVVELIARNIQKLPASTQNVLKLAACIGNQFNLEILSIANSESTTITAAQLWEALQAGLILPMSDAYKIPLVFGSEEEEAARVSDVKVDYKFLHDRVQQAAYALIPEREKKETHLTIGQLLLENITPEEQKENIFALVNQLNFGTDLLTVQEERDELADLNLFASQKAKAAAAYEASLNYINVGLELLGEESWQRNYDLMRTIYLEAIEAEYLNSNFERSQSLAKGALERAKTLLEKVKVYELLIQGNVAKNQQQAALELGQQVLEMLGVKLDKEPPSIEMIEELADRQEMTDAIKLAAMRILTVINSSAFVVNPQLLPLIIFTQVNLCIKYGNSPIAATAYIHYGMLLCGFMENFDGGYRFGKLGLRLLEKYNARELKSIVLDIFNNHIRHWKEHVRETIEPLQEAVQSGGETGEYMFSGYAALSYCTHSFLLGDNLEAVDQKYVEYTDLLTKRKLKYHVISIELYHQTVLNLQDRSSSAVQLKGEAFNESEILPILQEENNYTLLFLIYLFRNMLLYLFKQPGAAVENAKLAEACISAVPGLLVGAQHNFYYSLALLANYPQVEEQEQSEYLSQVAGNQETMKNWAYHAPCNFQHKYQLVEAEKARVLGDNIAAIALYEEAIKGAREQGYAHEEALGNELAGEFHLARGHENMGRFYIIECYYGYIRWGAIAKVKDLESRYPQYLVAIKAQKPGSAGIDMTRTATMTTTTGTGQILDFSTVMKASQAISSEIVLDKLLKNLMKIIMENAGAQVGVLMLEQAGELRIQAVGNALKDEVKVLQGIPVETSDGVPLSVINYVARTKKNLVINHVAEDVKFSDDPYIKLHQPKSVSCLPVKQGKMLGILYLENNLVTGAFTDDRINILTVLSTQAAISLENAELFESLERSEASEREKSDQLEHSMLELENAQLQLVQSEKMSALGQLVAGVAHEINNPVSFIAGNISPATEYVGEMFELLHKYQEKFPTPGEEIEEKIKEMDLEYLEEDLPKLISSMKEGTDRIRQISTSLRTFSRSDTVKKVLFNIHEGIDSTLMILQHRLKADQHRPAIAIVKEYGDLPEVECYPGQLNQVFMNLLANGIDALEESNVGREYEEIKASPNQITIRTEANSEYIVISIKDNGPGIPADVKKRLFDHLFTTKAVGKGTGLGLSISRQIIEEKHGGKLSVISELGEGAEFVIEIPR